MGELTCNPAPGENWSKMLDVLAAQERRQILVSILGSGECSIPIRNPAMVHNHIPKLEACDYIDQDGDVVKAGEDFEEIEPVLELLEENSDELPDGWI